MKSQSPITPARRPVPPSGTSRQGPFLPTAPFVEVALAVLLLALPAAIPTLGAATPALTWTVLYLHPDGAESSSLTAVTGTQQAGEARINGEAHAAIWAGSAGSFQDLNPSGLRSSLAGTNGTRQAGYFLIGNLSHAAIWTGTTAAVDLHPALAGVSESVINCSGGRLQEGGYLAVGAETHAAYWDEKNVCHDLNPAGSAYSMVYGVNSEQQGGIVGQLGHAALWSGTKAYVDLNPTMLVNGMPTAAIFSGVLGLGGGGQVGLAYFTESRAARWTGTAASFVDLHPTNVVATASVLFAATSGWQVGTATIGGQDHAGLWADTPESFVDLHALLSARFESSVARGVWTDGTTTLVAGYGKVASTGLTEAILWKLAPATPVVVAAPQVSIAGAGKVTTGKAKLTIRGQATGAVTSVTVRVGHKAAATARGTASWTFKAALRPGKTKITATAHGPGGDSAPTSLTVVRRHP